VWLHRSRPTFARSSMNNGCARSTPEASSSGTGVTVAPELVGGDRGRQRTLRHLALRLVRLGREPGLDAGHELLLPHARHADEQSRPRLEQVGQQLVRVGTEIHLAPR